MVSDYLFRTDAIVTAILHDIIEDTALTKDIITREFGRKIADQVESPTRVKKDGKISSTEIIEILLKKKKNDLLLIKLLDRLHNMQTVEAKLPEKMQKIISETSQSFLDLASYLKMSNLEKQLEEYCLNMISNYLSLDMLLCSDNTEEV